MSADYYARLERGQGPQPSRSMIAAIAQGLHLTLAERDHLFHLAGQHPPTPHEAGDHISPGMLRIFDRLQDSAAEIVTELGETLRQTASAIALTGDTTHFTGPARSLGYRWFTDAASRSIYAPDDHPFLGRMFASGLREVAGRRGPGSRAARYVDLLLAESPEFAAVWAAREVGLRPREIKRYVHPEVGPLELECQTLLDPTQSQYLLVYTATPGSDSYQKLQLLAVVGAQSLRP
jgi:hypothetical protein